MKRIPLTLLAALAMACVATAVPPQQDRPVFWSLLPEGSSEPSGYIVIRIPPERVVPSDWEMTWFVALYTPKGLRLPLGYIEDSGKPGDASFIALRVPAGTHRIEITRPAPSREALGAFDLDKGKWIPWTQDAILTSQADVVVLPGRVRLVSISYRNPQTHSQKEGDHTTVISIWENWALVQAEAPASALPKGTPKPFPLLGTASLAALDSSHLVAALKDKESRDLAEGVLLAAPTVPVEAILAGLTDKSFALSWGLARVLVKSRDPRAVPALAAALENPAGELDTRTPAAWALGELGDVRALDALKAALRDKEVFVRNYAAIALGKVKGPGVVEALTAATKDTGTLGRGMIFTLLEESPTVIFLNEENRVMGVLLDLPYTSVRQNAVYSLGQTGDPVVVEPLVALLQSPDRSLRLEAIYALGNYSGPRVVEALKSRMGDEQAVRMVVAHLLGKVGDASVAEFLEKVAKQDSDAQVREFAAKGAEKIRKRAQPAPAKKAPPAKKPPVA
jgi:HEAT repeat protein